MHRAPAAALLTIAVLATAGCVGPLKDFSLGTNCNTAVNTWQGMQVDLTSVLLFEGGPYDVTVSVPAAEATFATQIAGNSLDPLVVLLDVDLDRHPVTVNVEVTSPDGFTYEAADTVTPLASSPKSRACTGTTYWAGLQAQPDGQLIPLAWGEPARDAQGRVSVVVDSQCGVGAFYLEDGTTFVRVEGVLDDGAGGPPKGWASPVQRGWVDPSEDMPVFEDERGHREVFRPWLPGDTQITCAA